MKKMNMILYPSTIDQLNLILNELTKNDDYSAKIGNIEIGLAYKTNIGETFYIRRNKKED